jgi:hypothetical protein
MQKILTPLIISLKYIIITFIIIYGSIIMFNHNPSLHSIAMLVAAIGFLITYNTILLEDNIFIESIKRDLRIAEIQQLILKETKEGKKQTIDIITNAANLLQKMTNIAMNKPDNK